MGGINALEARRRILLNTPHIETASGSIATFSTDMVCKLRECKFYFEPVQEAGTPTPENPLPISGWTAAKIYSAGKNLFNPDINLWEPYISENSYRQWRMKYPTGITVTISVNSYNAYVGTPTMISSVHPVNSSYNSGVRLDNNLWGNNKTTKLNDNGYLYIGTVGSLTQLKAQMTQNGAQVEIGSKTTSYEPYQCNSYDVVFPSNAGTVYGGYVDLVKGEVVATKAAVTFDGSQEIGLNNWRNNSGSVAWLYSTRICPGIKTDSGAESDKITVMCDTMTPIPYGTMFEVAAITSVSGVVGGNWSIAMRVADTSLTTVAAKNAWLTEHPATVVYNLSTPIHYPIDPIVLKTLRGINNVFSDLNGNAEVKFYTH